MSTQRLAELINQKHDVLVQLHQLGRRQAALIDGDDINNLLVLLSAKQTLLSQLQVIEKNLDPYRHDDPDARTWATTGDRQRCADMVRRCERLLAEIVAVEKQSEQEMERKRDAAAAKLEETGSAAEARRAYGRPTNNSSGQLDVCSDSF